MEEEIVIYDFCGTIVDFQTANAYVRFVIENEKIRRSFSEYFRLGLNFTRLMPIINRCRQKMSLNKSLLLRNLKGIKFEKMNHLAKIFYEESVRPHFNEEVLTKLKNDIKNGKKVIIISGGYDIYLKYFAAEFHIKYVICSNLKFCSDMFSGSIEGRDCMGEEKVIKLKEVLPLILDKVKKSKLTLYSDSETDIPLFKECENRIVILDSKEIPDWANNIATEIIHINKN